jgi:hypothetical protein
MIITNQNCFHEEIRSKLNFWNVGYHSVQNYLSSNLLSKNIKLKVYIAVIFSVVLCGCQSWSVTVRRNHMLRGLVWAEQVGG